MSAWYFSYDVSEITMMFEMFVILGITDIVLSSFVSPKLVTTLGLIPWYKLILSVEHNASIMRKFSQLMHFNVSMPEFALLRFTYQSDINKIIDKNVCLTLHLKLYPISFWRWSIDYVLYSSIMIHLPESSVSVMKLPCWCELYVISARVYYLRCL